ncbi:maleylpyruvate isomerase family mycothiol-dependent enzyme [Agrococcus sp. TF02-05]|uniref:maleylpyruvate isomerase family mycothiol-dependent enzyme n=1 Tax=Agrococcus sp. TF02-05 TaxID=2815211 RepID=UPI001AA0BE08|nr:maleylpyruvate isomerase family mycothiol-dependent enzyme [Agrococcus sp. TF02-05]MBO1769683.1 maleylpyruvate isomerase family mycothiol-dependent enzyme [Agrococcus sp. TF02-05]
MAEDGAWAWIDAERQALADDLAGLDDARWSTPSLCAGLSVREVLAHLTVSGAVSRARWLVGVLRARFDFDRQVDDRLREQLGETPAVTLARFRATIGSRVSPPLPRLALLDEVVVHGEDIRRPLGIARAHPPEVLAAVLRYYAGTDLVVVAKRRVRGLRLEATDVDVAIGEGDAVRGSALALIMAMTGRAALLPELAGPGLPLLAARSG